jgi:hypothetical protein
MAYNINNEGFFMKYTNILSISILSMFIAIAPTQAMDLKNYDYDDVSNYESSNGEMSNNIMPSVQAPHTYTSNRRQPKSTVMQSDEEKAQLEKGKVKAGDDYVSSAEIKDFRKTNKTKSKSGCFSCFGK